MSQNCTTFGHLDGVDIPESDDEIQVEKAAMTVIESPNSGSGVLVFIQLPTQCHIFARVALRSKNYE